MRHMVVEMAIVAAVAYAACHYPAVVAAQVLFDIAYPVVPRADEIAAGVPVVGSGAGVVGQRLARDLPVRSEGGCRTTSAGWSGPATTRAVSRLRGDRPGRVVNATRGRTHGLAQDRALLAVDGPGPREIGNGL